MKKSKTNTGASKKTTAKEEVPEQSEPVPVKVDSLDDEEQGFGGWLRSDDGLETMKLFVIANSIVMVTTLIYPQMKIVYEIVSDMIFSPDNLNQSEL